MCESSISELFPQGRLKIGRDAILDNFSRPCGLQRCCVVHPGLASWAKFSRPYGTQFVNPGSHTRSSVLGYAACRKRSRSSY